MADHAAQDLADALWADLTANPSKDANMVTTHPQVSPNYGKRAAWLIGGLLLFRLVYAAWLPLDLVHDEAYYWDWSRQLDFGYYSKPPMVAWLIRLATSVGATTVVEETRHLKAAA